jgi:hypothetical protein
MNKEKNSIILKITILKKLAEKIKIKMQEI